MAKSNLMIDNDRTRVTEWIFEIGGETGQHVHEFDYVVVPLLDGELTIIDEDGSRSVSKLFKGKTYYRDKGVSHNVINTNDFQFRFVEVEIK